MYAVCLTHRRQSRRSHCQPLPVKRSLSVKYHPRHFSPLSEAKPIDVSDDELAHVLTSNPPKPANSIQHHSATKKTQSLLSHVYTPNLTYSRGGTPGVCLEAPLEQPVALAAAHEPREVLARGVGGVRQVLLFAVGVELFESEDVRASVGPPDVLVGEPLRCPSTPGRRTDSPIFLHVRPVMGRNDQGTIRVDVDVRLGRCTRAA
ncbi:unnamed protein product [Ectocarpus fasciculatus]